MSKRSKNENESDSDSDSECHLMAKMYSSSLKYDKVKILLKEHHSPSFSLQFVFFFQPDKWVAILPQA